MSTNIYITVNGKEYKANATLKDFREIRRTKYLKVERCYTFKMRDGYRRVIKCVGVGEYYYVFTMHAIAPEAQVSRTEIATWDLARASTVADELGCKVHSVRIADLDFGAPWTRAKLEAVK